MTARPPIAIQYVRFREAVQAPGPGGGSNSVYRCGEKYNKNTTNSATLLEAIVRSGDEIVLVSKRGQQRRVPFNLVLDFERPDDELTDDERAAKEATQGDSP